MTTTPTDLRALADALDSYAKDADDHGNHWAPITPTTLRAAAVALRAAEGDVRRYRWLRDDATNSDWEWLIDVTAQETDAAIDAAIAQEQKP